MSYAGDGNLTASAPNGANGSFETFEAGKPGQPGYNLNQFSYTFTEAFVSHIDNTPAFSLRFSGGNGGNGGSSACCNGGVGGEGGVFGYIQMFGPTELSTTNINSPGFLARVITGNGGNGGDSGACCQGGDGWTGGSGGWLKVSTGYWSIRTGADDSPAFQAVSYAGNGGSGGTGATGGSSGGAGGQAGHIFVGAQAEPFVLDAQTLGAQSPGISIAMSPMDGNGPTGNGGQWRCQ